MKVEEAMNRGVITIKPQATPLEAFQGMYKEGVRRLFVVDHDENPVGVVTYSDLMIILSSSKPNKAQKKSVKIADIMSTDIITISADNGIEDAANLMVRADISGLLVMDDDKPVGVITKTDICRLVAAKVLVPN